MRRNRNPELEEREDEINYYGRQHEEHREQVSCPNRPTRKLAMIDVSVFAG